MSNPETKYITFNQDTGLYQDLSGIFQPLSIGYPYPLQTGFLANGQDFNAIFSGTSLGTKIDYNVNYTFNGTDLSQIFQKYNSSVYNIENASYLQVSEIKNNGYTGLILETTAPVVIPAQTTPIYYGTCNIIFNVNKLINVLAVGGGGGGGSGWSPGTSGGGAGGAGYISTTFNTPTNNLLDLQIGFAGGGRLTGDGGTGTSGGSSGGTTSITGPNFSAYAFGGQQGLGIGTTIGYAGGKGGDASNNIVANNGGGGGGGGGATSTSSYNGTVNNAAPINGALFYFDTSNNFGNFGTNGSGNNGNGGSGTGGDGGNAFNSTIQPPFLSSGSIYHSNGGAGGYYTSGGGKAGFQSGGTGYVSSNKGANAVSGLYTDGNYYYGNGGGGGCQQNTSTNQNMGGNGGNGVIIFWWQD